MPTNSATLSQESSTWVLESWQRCSRQILRHGHRNNRLGAQELDNANANAPYPLRQLGSL